MQSPLAKSQVSRCCSSMLSLKCTQARRRTSYLLTMIHTLSNEWRVCSVVHCKHATDRSCRTGGKVSLMYGAMTGVQAAQSIGNFASAISLIANCAIAAQSADREDVLCLRPRLRSATRSCMLGMMDSWCRFRWCSCRYGNTKVHPSECSYRACVLVPQA